MSEITLPNGALLSFIERAAKDETFDVQKFGELLRLQRDVSHDQARRTFNAAMAACQSEMEPVLRGSVNPGVRSKYAKLEAIDQQMRPIYTRHGFSVRFGSAPPPQPGWMRITCTVAHEGGYFEENYLDSPVTTQGAQGGRIAMTAVQAVGSVVTYLRRYLLGMVFNIVQADVVGEDDDGEGQRQGWEPASSRAAATTQRASRVAEKAAVYEAPAERPLPNYTNAQWDAWLAKLRSAASTLYHSAELDDMAAPATMVGKVIAEGPDWVKRDIDDILATNYKRLSEPPKTDDLPEVEIEGADKLSAG